MILNEKNVNMSALTRSAAEEMAENLTLSYSGFINHRLIMEGCKHEYIWSKINPAMDPSVLNNAVLNVCRIHHFQFFFFLQNPFWGSIKVWKWNGIGWTVIEVSSGQYRNDIFSDHKQAV